MNMKTNTCHPNINNHWGPMSNPPSDSKNNIAVATTLPELIGAALLAAGGRKALGLDDSEAAVAKGCLALHGLDVEVLRARVAQGDDILGREYCRLKSAEERRAHGATFTPDAIVDSMLDWAQTHIDPAWIIDPGAGSARYALAAAQRFPNAKVVAVEIDPFLRILAKARISIMGLSGRVLVEGRSFLDCARPRGKGSVLYIGNPPYVRHHDIDPADKAAYAERCKALGVSSSGLSGLHIHFMVKVFEQAKAGDAMAFITAAEWMDTNYGKSIRQLLASGEHDAFVGSFAKEEVVFEDALASAAISCVRFGTSASHVKFDTLSSPKKLTLGRGKKVAIATAQQASSWNGSMHRSKGTAAGGRVLGDLFKVSRGMVTGMNEVWVVSDETPAVPERFLRHCITNAEDITTLSDWRLTNASRLRKVVVLPEDLSTVPKDELPALEAFLEWAKQRGADATYTAKHRKHWWRIDVKEPPPIVMTYMGRRPPVFARNIARAPLLNIAHGLYPKVEISPEQQEALVAWLNKNVSVDAGRAYAGGLVKFEPKEAMRIAIPDITTIMERSR